MSLTVRKLNLMKNRVFFTIVVMGFSGLVAQILLLREFLIIFSGNEFEIGIILANWLVLEAIGSFFLGRMVEKTKHRLETYAILALLFSLSTLAAVFMIRVLKPLLDISIGESIRFLPMFFSSFLILAPVCILHGASFTFNCRIYSLVTDQDTSTAGRVYAYEAVGTVIGGIACTYLLIPYLDSFQAFAGLALLNSVACFILLAPQRKNTPYQKRILAISGVVLLLFSGLTTQAHKLHHYSIQAQWKNQNVVHYQNSQYGNICVIENEGQYIYFQDGIPNFITPIPDIPFVEEFVHLPLLAHPDPKKILILSGGAGGVINEVLKHPSIETIEYAELDPLIIDLFKKFSTPLTESELNDSRVEIKYIDGRLLLKTTRDKYDLILIGIREPSNLQANRFYTKEFFSLAKERLNYRGIVVIGLPGSLSYTNAELQNLNSSIYHTQNSVFPHIRALPGYGTNLFLLSNSREILTLDTAQVSERLEQRKIKSGLIIPWYIEEKLHQGWQGWFDDFIAGSSLIINSDFHPIGVFYSIAYWNTLNAPSLRPLFRQLEQVDIRSIVLIFVPFLILFSMLRFKKHPSLPVGITFSIFSTGFAGMIFDLMLIFTFQSIYGHVFSWIGLLIAAFMAGAACGSMLISNLMDRIKDPFKFFSRIELAILGFSLGCLLIIYIPELFPGGQVAATLIKLIFLLISFISGLLISSQFPLANKLYLLNNASLTKTAGLLYAADLLGGWFGGMVGAVLLLPVLGLVGTCITVGLLKLTSFILLKAQPNPYFRGGQNEPSFYT